MIKKVDWYIAAAVVVLAAISFAIIKLVPETPGAYAEVFVNGELYGSYALDAPRRIEIASDGHFNTVEIKDGAAFMAAANCRDLVCVAQKPISTQRQTIVCLPNRVSIVVRASGDVDVVVGVRAGCEAHE